MNAEPERLQPVFDRAFAGIRQVRNAFTPQLKLQEVGAITPLNRYRESLWPSRRGL
jgi:hypothetical protein